MQDINSSNSAHAAQLSFNTLLGIKDIANFYAMGSRPDLACYSSEECKNSNIADNTSQPLDFLVPGQKGEIIKHFTSREPYWMLKNNINFICGTMKNKSWYKV